MGIANGREPEHLPSLSWERAKAASPRGWHVPRALQRGRHPETAGAGRGLGLGIVCRLLSSLQITFQDCSGCRARHGVVQGRKRPC